MLQSGVSINLQNLAGVVDMSQVPNYVSFGEPRSGTITPAFEITSAVSDLVGDSDPGPGEPLLQSGVSLNMPNFAGIDDVSQVPNYVSFGEPRLVLPEVWCRRKFLSLEVVLGRPGAPAL